MVTLVIVLSLALVAKNIHDGMIANVLIHNSH